MARSRLLYIILIAFGLMMFISVAGFAKKGSMDNEIQTADADRFGFHGMSHLYGHYAIKACCEEEFTVHEKSRSKKKQPNKEASKYLKEQPASIEKTSKDKETFFKNTADNNKKKNSSSTPGESENEATHVKFKRVALTFDDGPHPRNTEKILELLKKYNAKATFFMLGSNVEHYPEIAKKIAEEGHETGNHTWNHKDLRIQTPEKIMEEVEKTNEIIERVTGVLPSVFRPPYGTTNEQVETAVLMTPVMWTVDTLDWKNRDPEAIIEIVQSNVEDGSIILMHDIHDATVEALEVILEYLDKEGYNFVTISELEKY